MPRNLIIAGTTREIPRPGMSKASSRNLAPAGRPLDIKNRGDLSRRAALFRTTNSRCASGAIKSTHRTERSGNSFYKPLLKEP